MRKFTTHLHIRTDQRTKDRLEELAGGVKNISKYIRNLINREWLSLHPEGEPSRLDDQPPAGTE